MMTRLLAFCFILSMMFGSAEAYVKHLRRVDFSVVTNPAHELPAVRSLLQCSLICIQRQVEPDCVRINYFKNNGTCLLYTSRYNNFTSATSTLLAFQTLEDPVCPPNFSYSFISNTCYQLRPLQENFASSRSYCNSLMPGIVHPMILEHAMHVEGVQNFLDAFEDNYTAICDPKRYWTSGMRESNNFNFFWSPFPGITIPFVDQGIWYPNQADNYRNRKYCLETKGGSALNDAWCFKKRSVLCEAKAFHIN